MRRTKLRHVRPRRTPVKLPMIPEVPTKQEEPIKVSEPTSLPSSETKNDLKSRVISLQMVMYKRNGCSRCKLISSEIEKLGLTDDILYKDVDTEGLTGLKNLPVGSISLPIFTSKKTNKNTFGYYPIEKIVSLLE